MSFRPLSFRHELGLYKERGAAGHPCGSMPKPKGFGMQWTPPPAARGSAGRSLQLLLSPLRLAYFPHGRLK